MSIEILQYDLGYHLADLLTEWGIAHSNPTGVLYAMAIDTRNRSELRGADYYYKLQVL